MSDDDFLDNILIKDQSGQMVMLSGGDFVSPQKVASTPLPDEEKIVKEIIAISKLKFKDTKLLERFKNIIVSRLKNVRDKIETEQVFSKPVEKGGLGMDGRVARRLIAVIESRLGGSGKPPRLYIGDGGKNLPHKEMEKELKASKKSESKPGTLKFNSLASQIVSKLNLELSPELRKRLEMFVMTYLRDVRDRLELRDAVGKSSKQGGIGLKKEEVDKLLAIIVETKKKLTSKNTITSGITHQATAAAPRQVKQPIFKKRKDEEAGAEVFEKKEKPVKEKFLAPPPPVPLPKPVSKQSTLGGRAPKPSLEAEKKEEPLVLPRAEEKARAAVSSRGSAVIPSIEPVLPKKKFFSLRKKKTLTSQTPAPATQKTPAGNMSGRPKIEDVKFVPKLVGPTEELRRMTIRDFRKLSEDPKIAAEKIKDKIDLLEEESFAKRIAGVKAWRESSLYGNYLKVGRLSLEEGKSIPEAVEYLENRGEPALTENEFNAIMELNRKLRV